MNREMCYRCFWPKRLCWCESITPVDTRTKIVILMHPNEYKHKKAATGRFTHLCLKNSQIRVGIGFDENTTVQALLHDPLNYPVLLYPCEGAINISKEGFSKMSFQNKQLLVFLLDATWNQANKMFKTSKSIQELPRIMFVPAEKSRYIMRSADPRATPPKNEATAAITVPMMKGFFRLARSNHPPASGWVKAKDRR